MANISQFLWFLLSPLNLAVFCICAAMVCLLIPKRRIATRFGIATCAILVIFAVLPVGYVLTAALESRYSRPDPMPKRVAGIIVLGGMMDTSIGLERGAPQLNNAADRIITFVNLARKYPYAKLVFTGGMPANIEGAVAEADMAAAIFKELDFNPRNRLIIENESRTTFENVKNTKALLEPKENDVWLAVTSAYHMPRTMGVFAANDWRVVPYPTDYQTGGVGRDPTRPNTSFLQNLTLSHLAIKEIMGTALYAFAGRWKPQPKPEPDT